MHAVVIATRHNRHASTTIAALRAGKHVFCEKPLCLTEEELRAVAHEVSAAKPTPVLMVGFNRRFAPMAVRMKEFVSEIREPLAMHYRVNAGFLPADHWTNDPQEGGGRILGEVCHFVDYLTFIDGSPIAEVQARSLASGQYSGDNSRRPALQRVGTISCLANNVFILKNGSRFLVAVQWRRLKIFASLNWFVTDAKHLEFEMVAR
jgi:predicted dehydrogenase